MGQPIYCSAPGDSHEADVIIGMVANGDQTMLCFGHLEDWCRAYLDAVSQAEADETAAETERRLAGVHPPAGSAEAEVVKSGWTDSGELFPSAPDPTSPESSDAGAAPAESPGGDASASESEPTTWDEQASLAAWNAQTAEIKSHKAPTASRRRSARPGPSQSVTEGTEL